MPIEIHTGNGAWAELESVFAIRSEIVPLVHATEKWVLTLFRDGVATCLPAKVHSELAAGFKQSRFIL